MSALRQYKVKFYDNNRYCDVERIYQAHDAKDALTYAEFEASQNTHYQDGKRWTSWQIMSIESVEQETKQLEGVDCER